MKPNSLEAMKSSDLDDWATPHTFIEYLEEAYKIKFDLDACASADNYKIFPYMDKEIYCCFANDWFGRHVFMNPPYGKHIKDFTNRAINQVATYKVDNVWLLLPARSDTTWFQELVNHPTCHTVVFYQGRFNFQHPTRKKGSALFPSVLIRLKSIASNKTRIRKTYYTPLSTHIRGF